jgi:Porin PorA
MRRLFGGILVVLAILLLAGGALIKWVAAPALVKIPQDVNRTTVATGQSQVFVLTAQAEQQVPVIATRVVKADATAGTSSVTVFDETLCLRAATATTKPDSAGCLPATDPGFIQKTTDRTAVDRKTALPVADGQRFGTAVDGNKDIRHDGLGYTFPIDTKKTSYPFFDTVLGKSFPMNYEATQKIEGLDLYRFRQTVPESDIKINGLLPGRYSNVRIVWVEPTTGVIVKGSEQIVEKFAATGQTAFSGTLVFDDPTVKSQADYAKNLRLKVQIVRIWAPIGVAALGLILLVVGLILLLHRRRPPTDYPVPEPARSQT